jgi:hypothetical protein
VARENADAKGPGTNCERRRFSSCCRLPRRVTVDREKEPPWSAEDGRT